MTVSPLKQPVYRWRGQALLRIPSSVITKGFSFGYVQIGPASKSIDYCFATPTLQAWCLDVLDEVGGGALVRESYVGAERIDREGRPDRRLHIEPDVFAGTPRGGRGVTPFEFGSPEEVDYQVGFFLNTDGSLTQPSVM